ncbi:serine/threonine-protein kinase [Streptomyces sp. CA-250714]|uniref:serine/threonine-protein kinase n=1 Tax=Streptomyces sp. CA-250714 TaxID=3240060 RepID=UPI003D8C445D
MRRGELIAGRYELLERLGRGGMGEVWAARDRTLRRDVALKLLDLGGLGHPELPQWFEREAVAAAQINHPNVVGLYDRGVHEDVLFLVMEKVAGTTLSAHIRAESPMLLARALEIADGICTALVAAHRARVIHYDIKPQNVMITEDRQVKVFDFGIAGFIQTTFSVAHSSQLTPAGTPEYGAPEQFLTERGDERSDLYALGGVLFALLTRQAPFTGPNGFAVMRRKLDEEAPRLDSLRPGLPPEVTGLVAELLQRDPDRRPQSAQLVLERLRQLQAALVPVNDGTSEARTTEEQQPPTRLLDGIEQPPGPTDPFTELSPQSWDNSSTDETPFTEGALLPQRFTNDFGIDFARAAGGARPYDLAASSYDMVAELAARGCTQVMAGVYLEQPGPHATPENPVVVSVQVFPFPDAAAAKGMFNYLWGNEATWSQTFWLPQAGGGVGPCPGGDEWHQGFRYQYNNVFHRYLIAALSTRTDHTTDGTIEPWLAAAATRAVTSSGPQNYRGS